jgi:hypothetical protein
MNTVVTIRPQSLARPDCDREALRGFVRDVLAVSYADAAAVRTALIGRTGATSIELLLAAIDVLREQAAALGKARTACGDPA